MYYLNKIVGWCLSPLGILFLGLGMGWLLRRRLLGRIILAFVLVLTWVMGCGLTTRFIGVPLEGEETSRADISEVTGGGEGEARIDAVVLLGGGVGVHEECGRPELFGGADRAWEAARVWRALHVPITVSGGGARGELQVLSALGVETNAVLVIEEARNTEEEAALIAKAISEVKRVGEGEGAEGVPSTSASKLRVALVTSAWHMPRAKMLFERVGFEVVPCPADYEMHYAAEEPIQIRDFFPNAEALARNSYAVKEWVARFFYWVKG